MTDKPQEVVPQPAGAATTGCATCEARVPEGEGTYDPLTGGVICDECREKYCDD